MWLPAFLSGTRFLKKIIKQNPIYKWKIQSVKIQHFCRTNLQYNIVLQRSKIRHARPKFPHELWYEAKRKFMPAWWQTLLIFPIGSAKLLYLPLFKKIDNVLLMQGTACILKLEPTTLGHLTIRRCDSEILVHFDSVTVTKRCCLQSSAVVNGQGIGKRPRPWDNNFNKIKTQDGPSQLIFFFFLPNFTFLNLVT